MPAKSKQSKSNKTSEVTFYPSFQALAEAARNERQSESAKTPETDAPARTRTLRSAADVPREPVQWLWPERIPLGKVTLLVGDPGLGKTLIATDLAARTSRGLAFPACQPPALPGVCLGEPTRNAQTNDVSHIKNAKHPNSTTDPRQSRGLTDEHPPHSLPSAPGSVLILSANDSIADTLRPRLEAHGADLSKIFFADEVTDLRHDLAQLEQTLDEIPDCRLLLVDPVTAFVGPSDSHYHTIVRKVLAPLAELAARRKIAILAVTHLRKTAGRAIQSAAGSMGFVAAARTVWTVCREETQRRNLLLPVKNNVGPLPAGLAFSIETHLEIDAPIIRWDSLPVATTAENVGKPLPKPRGPEAEERHQAGEWLKNELANGPRGSFFLIHEAHEHGFSERTLRRALHAIGGQTRKEGYTVGWTWCLEPAPVNDKPESTATPPPAEQPGRFRETWPLRENPEKSAATAPLSRPIRNEAYHPSPRPTVEQSIRFLDCLESKLGLESKLKGDEPPPDPNSPTGHAMLDMILHEFRPTLTTDNRRLTTQKKSARSHSRLPTGTDSWHFTRQADSCEPAAMHLRDVSAQVVDESTTRRREDAV